MKALILVGGYGTRLRPLTLSVPKPLIHFCNRPIIEYQIQAAVQLGVKHVILAVAYQPEAMREALEKLERKYKIRVSCSVEDEPLMTAGPIRLARDLLFEDEENEVHPELFFTFNSDIICEFPLKPLLDFHLERQVEGTICVTKVTNPSLFGVVLYEQETNRVERFAEKPTEFVGNEISAGIYLLNRRMIDRIEPRPVSIEREIFPEMAAAKQLCAFPLPGYWADIGKPNDFLQGSKLHLNALRQRQDRSKADNLNTSTEEDSNDFSKLPIEHLAQSTDTMTIKGNVLIHPTASIGTGSVFGPDVTIGPNCKVGDGVRISNSALMANVCINNYAKIDTAIIGWKSTVGSWVRIEGLTVLGEDVEISGESFIRGAFVLPNKAINQSIYDPGSIIM